MEGVLVTGTARAALEEECVRCLGTIADELEVDLQELYVYDDLDTDPDEDDEVSKLQDDLVDLGAFGDTEDFDAQIRGRRHRS